MPIDIDELNLPRLCQTAAIISATTEAIVVMSTTIVVSFNLDRVLPSTALTSARRSPAVWTVSDEPPGSARSMSCLPRATGTPGFSVSASSVASSLIHSLAWSSAFMTTAPDSQP